jgi:HAD superfamily hydrolase (TIGR01450 family)
VSEPEGRRVSEPEGGRVAWTEEPKRGTSARRRGKGTPAEGDGAVGGGPEASEPISRVFRGYALDLDGTVYLGGSLLPGAAETIARIRGAGSRVVFLTNNPLRSPDSYAQRLAGLGVPADPGDVVTPLGVLTAYLAQRHPGRAVLTVAEPLVDQTLAAAGITVTAEPAAAGVVVISFDRTFSYAKLLAAYRAVRLFGARIVATNPDPFCPTPDGGLPDCAAMLAAVEACTGARAEAVLGKPSEHMAAELLRRLAVPARDAAVVGDRISTDVALARSLGMTSVLVLSGATAADEVPSSPQRPDYVIDGIAALLPDSRPSGPTEGSPR